MEPRATVAGGLGFEPRLTESESAVLPLNYPPPSEAVAMDLRARQRSSEMSGKRVRGRNAVDIRRFAALVHPRRYRAAIVFGRVAPGSMPGITSSRRKRRGWLGQKRVYARLTTRYARP